MAFAPHAGAHARGHIYWTTNGGDIGCANLDGKGVRWMVASSGEEVPTDVAVSPSRPKR
ncbi:MAG: hypothetical protein ACTHO8_08050 [Solirubrobacterales bacterium]